MYVDDQKVKESFERVKMDMNTLQTEIVRLREENMALKQNFNEWIVFLNQRVSQLERHEQERARVRYRWA